MDCYEVDLRVTFAARPHFPSLYETLVRTVTGNPPAGTPPPDDRPVTVRLPEKRLQVTAGGTEWRAVAGGPGEPSKLIERTLEQFERSLSFFSDIPITNIRVDTEWTHPWDGTWAELVKAYARAYVAFPWGAEISDLLEGADFAGDGYRGHALTGPMMMPQFTQSHSVFPPPEGMSEAFLFLLYSERARPEYGTAPASSIEPRDAARAALARSTALAERMLHRFEEVSR